jgi:hypothetical protein
MKVLMHHSQRAARSFVRGLEIRLKTGKELDLECEPLNVNKAMQKLCSTLIKIWTSTRVDEFAVKHERELQLSLIFHEEKIKEITTVSVVLYVIKNRVYLHKL